MLLGCETTTNKTNQQQERGQCSIWWSPLATEARTNVGLISLHSSPLTKWFYWQSRWHLFGTADDTGFFFLNSLSWIGDCSSQSVCHLWVNWDSDGYVSAAFDEAPFRPLATEARTNVGLISLHSSPLTKWFYWQSRWHLFGTADDTGFFFFNSLSWIGDCSSQSVCHLWVNWDSDGESWPYQLTEDKHNEVSLGPGLHSEASNQAAALGWAVGVLRSGNI